MVSIQRNGFDYRRDVLSVTLLTIVDGNETEIKGLLVHGNNNKRLKPYIQIVFVDGQYRFAPLSQLASGEERYNWLYQGLQMYPVFRKDRHWMTAPKIVINRSYSNTLSGLVLSQSKALIAFKTMLIFSKTIDLEYGYPFIETKTKTVWEDLKRSNLLPEQVYPRANDKFQFQKKFKNALKRPNFFWIKLSMVLAQRICTKRSMQLLAMLRPCCYSTLPTTESQTQKDRKRIILFMSFLSQTAVRKCPPSTILGGGQPPPLFSGSFWFNSFSNIEITLSVSSKTNINHFNIFSNDMRLIWWEPGERLQPFVHGSFYAKIEPWGVCILFLT